MPEPSSTGAPAPCAPARLRSQAALKTLAIEQGRIRVNDPYPAYISWETYEHIRAMLQDNYAEYDRNKTRGPEEHCCTD
jgi:hypothetical protein